MWRLWCSALALALLPPPAAGARVAEAGEGKPLLGTGPARPRLGRDLARQVVDSVPIRFQVALCDSCISVTLLGHAGPLAQLRGHTGLIHGMRFFDHGALTWSADGLAILWDTATARAVWSVGHDGPVSAAEVFPSGDRFVTSAAGAVIVWDVASRSALRRFERAAVEGPLPGGGGLEVFPCGSRLLSWSRSPGPAVLDVAGGGAVLDVASGGVVCEHDHPVRAAAVFPDGLRFTTISFDGVTAIWNATDCELVRLLTVPGRPSALGILAGGDAVAVTSNVGTTVWCSATGAMRQRLADPAMVVFPSAWNIRVFPDGRRVLTMSVAEAVIWDTESEFAQHRFARWPRPIDAIAIAQSGDVVVTCGGGYTTVWNAESGEREGTSRNPRPHGSSIRRRGCLVQFALVLALDPQGYGRGLPLGELASFRGRMQ